MAELRAEATLQVSHRLFAIVDGASGEIPVARHYENGLIEAVRKGACIATGIRSGGVRVSILILDGPPTQVDDGWDEVAEVTVVSRKGDLNVRSIDDWPDLPPLSTAGPGTYRVRAHAKGRDDEPHGAIAMSTEVFLLQIWPAVTAEPILHRHTDKRGEELRRDASTSRLQP